MFLYRLIVLISALAAATTWAETAATTSTTTAEVPRSSEGFSTPKINATLQAWSLDDTTQRDVAKSQSNFRLRRAEFKVSGTLPEKARYFVMLDAAKTINPNGDARVLQDLGIGFTILPGLEVVAGQFKIQTTAEGLAPSTELLLPERSMQARRYGDYREPGAMVAYTYSGAKLAAMISNGQGPNADSNRGKDLSVRLDVPVNKNFQTGAYALFGDLKYGEKSRLGANLRWKNELVQSAVEVSTGRQLSVPSWGVTSEIGYNLTESIQPVVRYEVLRPNIYVPVTASAETVGLNYYIQQNMAKLQASLSFLHNVTGRNGGYEPASGLFGTLWIVSFQAAI